MNAQWIYTGIILVIAGALAVSVSWTWNNLYMDRGLKTVGIGAIVAGVTALLIGVWA